MSKTGKMQVAAAVILVGAGLWIAGCKSAPELTQSDAQTLIQAKYDQTPPAGISIRVDHLGLSQGIAAKYWNLSRLYPVKYWADYTLTDEGKKALKLAGGGDVIEWRPASADDKNYAVAVVSVAANRLKARDVKEIQDETLPGVDKAKGVSYTEIVNLDGVPGPLQEIAHNPGNKLSTKRQADFSLEGGAWKLHSIE